MNSKLKALIDRLNLKKSDNWSSDEKFGQYMDRIKTSEFPLDDALDQLGWCYLDSKKLMELALEVEKEMEEEEAGA